MKHLLFFSLLFFVQLSLFAQNESAPLKINHLTGNFYVYTTYSEYEGQKVPAHGLYLVTDSGVVMIDTPWDSTQSQPLLDSIQLRHHKNVVLCIVTHWHADKTNGLAYFRKKGIPTYASKLTDEWCVKEKKNRAEFVFGKDTTFTVDGIQLETYFPGAGHTKDNIVVWFPQSRILYGGCLIKGVEAKDLGFLGDGDKSTYLSSLKNVRKKFRRPKFIVVSHQDWKSKKSLQHSIQMAKKL